jgi:hypothetical protein
MDLFPDEVGGCYHTVSEAKLMKKLLLWAIYSLLGDSR